MPSRLGPPGLAASCRVFSSAMTPKKEETHAGTTSSCWNNFFTHRCAAPAIESHRRVARLVRRTAPRPWIHARLLPVVRRYSRRISGAGWRITPCRSRTWTTQASTRTSRTEGRSVIIDTVASSHVLAHLRAEGVIPLRLVRRDHSAVPAHDARMVDPPRQQRAEPGRGASGLRRSAGGSSSSFSGSTLRRPAGIPRSRGDASRTPRKPSYSER